MRNKIKTKGTRVFTTRLCTTTEATTFYRKEDHLKQMLMNKSDKFIQHELK